MSSVRLGLALGALLGACAPLPPPSQPAPQAAPAPAPAPRGAPSWQLLARARDLDGRVVGEAPGRATIAIVFASWCGHCRHQIAQLAEVIDGRDDVRVVGINFLHHEEYDDRGDSQAVRAYLAGEAPWLQVVPAGEDLWRALGSPSKVPTLYVFDDAGELRQVFDRRTGELPTYSDLIAALNAL
jgi:thiol-disulfide isomerase/thioredoxin